MLIIDELTQTAVALFELWRSTVPKTSGLCLMRAGSKGDQARSMLDPDYELIQTFTGVSEFEVMTKYYEYMDWGEYRSEWPDLAVIPFFYKDAIEVLKALPKKIKPLSEVTINANGHTEPTIPSPIPLITIQDRAVWSVNIRILDDFGGHGEPPINEPELIIIADKLIRDHRPELLERVNSTYLICPIDIAEQMLWISAEKKYEYTLHVRVIAIPPDLPHDDLNTPELFAKCLGHSFEVVGSNGDLLELAVGEVMGVAAYIHSIWIEERYTEPVQMLTKRFGDKR